MRRLAGASLLALAVAITSIAHGADRLRAIYQVDLREGTDVKRVQAASDVTSGTPIEHELAKYKLVLSIDVGQSSTYVLNVSVAALASPGDVLLKGTFNGNLVGSSTGPLEFDVEQNGIRVSGAIALSSVQ